MTAAFAGDGTSTVVLTLSGYEVTVDEDGNDFFPDSYQAWGWIPAVEDEPRLLGESTELSMQLDVTPGVEYLIQVVPVKDGLLGGFDEDQWGSVIPGVAPVETVADWEPEPVAPVFEDTDLLTPPTAPVLVSKLSQITVEWDGLLLYPPSEAAPDDDGLPDDPDTVQPLVVEPPSQFGYVSVQYRQVGASAWLELSQQLQAAGKVTIADVVKDVSYEVRLQAVDKLVRWSDPSAVATITVVGVVGADLEPLIGSEVYAGDPNDTTAPVAGLANGSVFAQSAGYVSGSNTYIDRAELSNGSLKFYSGVNHANLIGEIDVNEQRVRINSDGIIRIPPIADNTNNDATGIGAFPRPVIVSSTGELFASTGGFNGGVITAGTVSANRLPNLGGMNGTLDNSQLPNAISISGNLTAQGAYDNPLTSDYTSAYVNSSGRIARVSSSERYKTNIHPAEIDVDELLDLIPVGFDWIDGGHPDVGLIAERVAEKPSLWWLVVRDEDGTVQGINYDRLSVALLAALRRQRAEFSDLAARVARLEGEH